MKHQDPGMYKGSAYSGYPFLMLSDPYLPNGSMSPLVSSPSPYGEVSWPLSLPMYVAGIVQAPTRAFFFFLTNRSPVSKMPGRCSGQAEGRRSGEGERCSAASACFAPNLLEELLFQSPHPLVLPLLLQQSNPSTRCKNAPSFFWVTGFGGEQLLVFVFREVSRSLTSVRRYLLVKWPGFGRPSVGALLWMMAQKVDLVLLKWQ